MSITYKSCRNISMRKISVLRMQTSLNRWVEQQKVLHVRVYKGDIVVFESEYPEQNYGKRRFRQMNMSGWIITRSNLQMVRLR